MRESLIIFVDCAEPGRIWQGVGDLQLLPGDTIDIDPAGVYLGGGELINVPDAQALINGTAERVDIQLSGVSEEAHRLAVLDAEDVKGSTMYIGTIRFDDAWQQDGPVTWEASYRIDTIETQRQPGTRSLRLSMGSEDTGRSRAPNKYWTDADQRRRSPTDAIFSHVGKITSGTSRVFGTS